MWPKKIGAKLILVVGFILTLSLGIFAYVNITSQKKQLTGEVMRGAFRISETIRRSTRYDMLRNLREDLHQMIETIGQQEGLEKIRIFNKEGQIMFSSEKDDMGQMVDKRAEACYACHSAEKPLERLDIPDRSRIFTSKADHRVLGVISAIYNEPDCYTPDCHAHPPEQKVLGVLDIGMSLEDVDQEIEEAQNKMIIFALIAFLVIAVTISISINRYVTRPVRVLVEGTKKIAEGDLSYSILLKSADEIGELASSFNQMTSDLKKADEKLGTMFGKEEDKDIEKEKKTPEQKEEPAGERVTAAEIFAETDIIPVAFPKEIKKEFYDLSEKIDEELEAIKEACLQQTRGPSRLGEKELSDIVSIFTKSVEERIDMKDSETRYNLGVAFLEQGLVDEAIQEFKRAQEDKNLRLECSSLLSLCYKKKGEFQEALKWIESALKLAVEDSNQFYALQYEAASLNEEMNQTKKAMKIYKKIKKWNPEFRDVASKIKNAGK